ncbi:MAG: GNAT family N-acetyltransferase [Rhodobacteraceae bacterium]|nr:GNAT family N-acetyltransferase [Paracoccaceae bacterium]
MRPSLEAIGRFDPQRARMRFLEGFVPDDTVRLCADGQTVGFFVLKSRETHLFLDHLYFLPSYQGRGAGSVILQRLKDKAAKERLPIRLCALRGSRSNDFYKRNGFRLVAVEEFDNLYVWHPEGETR